MGSVKVTKVTRSRCCSSKRNRQPGAGNLGVVGNARSPTAEKADHGNLLSALCLLLSRNYYDDRLPNGSLQSRQIFLPAVSEIATLCLQLPGSRAAASEGKSASWVEIMKAPPRVGGARRS